MKRIAVFSDGTWNSPVQGGPTNILHLARAVQPVADDGVEQVAFYDWGVGTDRKQVMGGLAGAGIDKNIQDCYRFLVHNYNPGDALYFFGFSRGAYTVRSLAGFMRNCGLLRREHASRIPEAFKLYRRRSPKSAPKKAAATAFRQQYAVADITRIAFVGVFDTVGALGIPIPFWGSLGKEEFLFHDATPSKIVDTARHAVSIDENREDFAPTLWEDNPNVDLKQVWFAGVHSDVGGGYPEQGLSNCALRWMMREAQTSGLVFEGHLVDAREPDPLGKRHDEFKGIYRARLKRYVRKITGPIHADVKKRCEDRGREYARKSKAMRALLASADGDWSRIEIEE